MQRHTDCRIRILLALCLTPTLLAAGCGDADGPELAEVTGKVMLNGEPLPDARVQFAPEDGRPSAGTTDENGVYELMYTSDTSGAVLGMHTVRITTAVEALEGEGDVAGREARAEVVPPMYNTASELTREVTSGSNTFDFDLESGGQTFPTGEEAGGGGVPEA